MPTLVEPCLLTPVDKAPSGERWWHEIKWDGYRLIAHVEGGSVRLLTRRGHDWTDRFPLIAAAMADLPVASAILDGEAVVEDDRGIPDHVALHAAVGGGQGWPSPPSCTLSISSTWMAGTIAPSLWRCAEPHWRCWRGAPVQRAPRRK